MSGDVERLLQFVDQAQGTVPNDAYAISFLEQFPLPELFSIFSTEVLKQQELEQVCRLLAKVLQTDFGTSLLPEARQYIEAALRSDQPLLRRLGCEQLGRLLNTTPSSNLQADVVTRLLGVLQDGDTGLLAEAERALKMYAVRLDHLKLLVDGSHAPGMKLESLIASSDPVVRLRALAFVVGAASESPEAVRLVEDSGLLEPLQRELRNTGDPLSCLAALQLLQDLAASAPGPKARAVVVLALPSVVALLGNSGLRQAALPIAAALVAAALEGQADSHAEGTSAPSLSSFAEPLLAVLGDILDEKGSDTAEAEAVALDAAGTLSVSTSGAPLVAAARGGALLAAVVGRALGRAANPDVRQAALHALASLAGAERAGAQPSLKAVELPREAETRLQSEVYRAAALGPGGGTPGACLHALLVQPFVDMRVAAYRLISALALRPWFAAEVARSSELVDRLLDPKSETGQRGCEWRHTAAAALQAGMAAAAALPAGHPDMPLSAALKPLTARVADAVRAGPYGAGARSNATPEHLVATLP